jgi:hypothetical protein
MSSRALVMILARLAGHVLTGKLFVVIGSIELGNRALVASMDMAIVRRRAAHANKIAVQALLT